MSLAAGAWYGLYDNFDIPAKKGEELHEPFGGESGKPSSQKAGNLWLVNLEDSGSRGLSEPARANYAGYPESKVGLGEAFLGVCQAEVGKDIPTPFLHCDGFNHSSQSLSGGAAMHDALLLLAADAL